MAADRIAAPDSPVPNCSIAISTNSTSQAPISSMRDERIATISRASGCWASARNPPRIAGPRASACGSSSAVQRRVVRLVRDVRRSGMGVGAEPEDQEGRGRGDQREDGEDRARPRHGEDRRRRQGPEQQAARLRDARDRVGRGQLGRVVGEAREERVVRGSDEGQRHRRRDRREVDHRHRPREQHPGGDQRGPGREQGVGGQEDVLPAEPVAERAPERRDDGRGQQLRERHEAHGRRSRRRVRVQQDRHPRPVLDRVEREERELDPPQGRVAEHRGRRSGACCAAWTTRRSWAASVPQGCTHAPVDAPTGPCALACAASGRGQCAHGDPDRRRARVRPPRVPSGLPPACADLPGSGGPRLGARAHPAARLARRRPRRRGPRARQLPRARRAGRERAPGPRPGRRGPRVLQRVPPPGHRGRGARVRQGRPLPVPLPRLDLRPRRQPRPGQAHRRPRRLLPRHLRPRPHPLPRPGRASCSCASPTSRSRRGSRRSSATSSRTWPASTSRASGRRSRSCTRSAPTGSSSPRTTASATTARASIPQLNKLTPYDLGGDFDPNGAWQGGWMELVEGAETMALDGGHGSRCGRPPMCGITPTDEQRDLLLRPVADDVPLDPPGLPARPSAGPRRQQPHPGRLRLAVRGRDDRRRGLRPVRRDRVLGPHQPPGLARVRAPAARDGVAQLGRRPLLEPRRRPCRRST